VRKEIGSNTNFVSVPRILVLYHCSSALKERGLEIQGNKNTLTTRLLEYEANR
jgi:hypothetical protein